MPGHIFCSIYSLYNHAIERERVLRKMFLEIEVKSSSSAESWVDSGNLLIVHDSYYYSRK